MAPRTEDDALREAARKRIKKKRDFQQYLWVWLFVGALTSGIWFFVTPDAFYWPGVVIAGMGIGAFFAALDAFSPAFNKVITEADVDAELERMRKRS